MVGALGSWESQPAPQFTPDSGTAGKIIYTKPRSPSSGAQRGFLKVGFLEKTFFSRSTIFLSVDATYIPTDIHTHHNSHMQSSNIHYTPIYTPSLAACEAVPFSSARKPLQGEGTPGNIGLL